jgi:cation diffusion facilitator CzcD-associated flavoprotein CzcO
MLPSRTLAALALLVAAYLVRRACRRTRKENLKYTCGIVGGGVGGVAAAYRLQKAGVQVFLYDVAPDFGGTWLHNSYPDCGCDVFSHAYSFSFAPNADWTRKFSKRDEILAYVQKTASDMGLRARAKFNTKVVSATFDGRVWELQLEDQATKQVSKVSHNFLVGATGQLNVPLFPRGVDAHAFKGPAFHTARWDHQVDLAGKRVACVGTGASAIQALPAIADKVRELVVFQRSPGWVVDKADYLCVVVCAANRPAR